LAKGRAEPGTREMNYVNTKTFWDFNYTTPWSRLLLEMCIVVQLVETFSAFHGIERLTFVHEKHVTARYLEGAE
jgi:hypothetical protein